jgi:hypothetical protein
VVEASILEIPLVADLVLLAEVLCYVPDHLADIVARVKAQYVLTSYGADFDDQVALCLRRCGWENCIAVSVLPRFEPIGGRTSFLTVRRPGSNIRLWKRA